MLRSWAKELPFGVRSGDWGRYPINGRELKNIYRWKMFRRYYEEARIAYFREWGRLPGRHHTRYGERMLELLNAPGIGELLKRN